MLLHPEVAGRTCDDCRRYVYDDTPAGMGQRSLRRDDKGRMTLPIHRPLTAVTPCHQCPKTSTGRREDAVEIDRRTVQVYRHYRECRAVGWQVSEANDPIVRRNAAIVREIEDAADQGREATLNALLGQLVATRNVR